MNKKKIATNIMRYFNKHRFIEKGSVKIEFKNINIFSKSKKNITYEKLLIAYYDDVYNFEILSVKFTDGDILKAKNDIYRQFKEKYKEEIKNERTNNHTK